MMHDVFLCHSGVDKRFVERVALVLEALGVRVFYDQKSIHTGETNELEIVDRGLFCSRALVAFVSPAYFDSQRSKWPQKETVTALCHGIAVFLVVLPGVNMDKGKPNPLFTLGLKINTTRLHPSLQEEDKRAQNAPDGKVNVGSLLRDKACVIQDDKTESALILKRLYSDVIAHLKKEEGEVKQSCQDVSSLSNEQWQQLWHLAAQECHRIHTPNVQILSGPVFSTMVDTIHTLMVCCVLFFLFK